MPHLNVRQERLGEAGKAQDEYEVPSLRRAFTKSWRVQVGTAIKGGMDKEGRRHWHRVMPDLGITKTYDLGLEEHWD